MKEVTIKIPDGWFLGPIIVFVSFILIALALPWYSSYWHLHEAKTQAEIDAILGQGCSKP